MTQIAATYAQALYDLAKEEQLTGELLVQLKALQEGFSREPDYVRLLSAPSMSKEARCAIADEAFRGKGHIYVLNFLKILVEKGYVRHFADCVTAYRDCYNADHGIVPVLAVTAVALTGEQTRKLTEKLTAITGKTVELENRIDPSVLGGVRLDYDGKRFDGTVKNRLDDISKRLKNTVL